MSYTNVCMWGQTKRNPVVGSKAVSITSRHATLMCEFERMKPRSKVGVGMKHDVIN